MSEALFQTSCAKHLAGSTEREATPPPPRLFEGEDGAKEAKHKKKDWKAFFKQKQEEALAEFLLPKNKRAAKWKQRGGATTRERRVGRAEARETEAESEGRDKRVRALKHVKKERGLKPSMMARMVKALRR